MLCAYVAAGVLSRLALNAAFRLSWADSAVALGIAALAISEGRDTWRRHRCCATFHVGADAVCQDDCCT